MLKKLSHIGIAVNDIEEALADYRQLFGLEPSHRERREEMGVAIAMLQVGGSQVELIQPLDPQGPIARFLERRGEGLHHIGFEVDNLEQALKSLEARGAAPTEREPRQGVEGRVAFLHPKATRGVLIELVERGQR